jgi:NADH-quinone oxidoreductase subunit L
MLISTSVALGGIGLAYRIYGSGAPADEPAKRFGGLYAALWNKYWVDEFYDTVFVNRTKDLGKALWVLDDAVLDGTVNGVAAATKQAGTASHAFDQRVVDGTVNGVANSIWSGSWVFRTLQTGMVQNYALVIAIGAFVLVSAYLFL